MTLIFDHFIGKLLIICISVVFSVLSICSATSTFNLMNGKLDVILPFLPALVILVYGFGACVYVKTHKVASESLANFTYFLGYLCTITALAVLVSRLEFNQDGFLDVKTVTMAVGVALTTTIVGLILMVLIKDMHSLDEAISSKIAEELKGVIAENRGAFSNLYNECKKTENALSKLRTSAGEFNSTLRDFNSIADKGKISLEQYTVTTGKCVESVEGLTGGLKALNEHQIPEHLVLNLNKALECITDLGGRCPSVSANLEKFGSSIEKCAGSVTEMDKGVSGNSEKLKLFNQAVGELDKVLRQFVELTMLRIRSEKRELHREEK